MPPKKYKTDEERRAAEALRKRLSRQNETEEQRRKRLEKDSAAKRERFKNETEEERKIRLAKNLAVKKRKIENETLEQREKRLARYRQENRRKSRDKDLELQRMKSREAQREFYKARNQLLTVEPHQYEEKLKEMENISERLKARLLKSLDPQRIEEAKARRRFQELVKRTTMTEEEKEQRRMENYLRQQAKLASMSREELQAFQEKRREYQREFLKNLSGEKLERYKVSVKKAVQKHSQKEVNRQKMRKKYERTLKTETPEQRQIRLQGYRINQAKKLLRKKLENAGASAKKIQLEVDKLVEKMKAEPLSPPEMVSRYKPRPRKKNIRQSREVKAEVTSEPYPSCVRDCNWTGKVDPEMPILQKCIFEEKPEESEEENDMAQSEDFDSKSNLYEESEDVSFPSLESPGFPDPLDTKAVSKPSSPMHIPSPKRLQYSESPNEPESMPKIQPSTSSWNCPKCKQVMSSSNNLTEHYKLFHCPQQQQRNAEGKNTKGRGRKIESKLKENRATFFCMKCPKITLKSTFQDKNKLFAHVKQKHSKFYFPCSNCNLLKYNSGELELHMKICSKVSKIDK